MKQTEIGLIPDDWEVKSLENICIPQGIVRGPFGGALKKSMFVKTGYKVYEQRNAIYKNITDGEYYIDETKYNEMNRFAVKVNDYIISCSGTIGKIYKIPENFKKGIINQALLKLTINETVIFSDFFRVYFESNYFQTRIIDDTQGGAMKNLVGMEKFRMTCFPVPPLAEQKRIAKALSDVDALISTTEKLIQKKKNIKQGAMQNLLTGKKRLPGFAKSTRTKMTELGEIPEDWEVKSLGDIFSIKHGYGFEGQFFSSENNQHIVVTPGNFKLEGGFQKQKQPIYYTGTYPDEFKLKPNNLIIMMTDLSKNSDTLGNPAIVPDDGNYYLHNQRIGLIQIHNDSFVKDYIYLLLCTKEYHESIVATAAGSTVKHTSPNRIYSINLIVSTSKEEQTAIANVLSSMDKEIETLNTKLEKYRNLKTAIMQQLLTGKIRLVK